MNTEPIIYTEPITATERLIKDLNTKIYREQSYLVQDYADETEEMPVPESGRFHVSNVVYVDVATCESYNDNGRNSHIEVSVVENYDDSRKEIYFCTYGRHTEQISALIDRLVEMRDWLKAQQPC